MRPAQFSLERPATVAEAVAALAGGGLARPLAGGQSLIAQLTRRELAVERLVDLAGIAALREVRIEAGELRMGAMVTLATLEDDPLIADGWPLLAACARHVAHRPIRVRSTVGGTLAFADPPAEVPLALAVLGAQVEVHTSAGARRVPAGQATYGAGDVITAVSVPAGAVAWGFHEVSRRFNDRAIAAAAAALSANGGVRLGVATSTMPPVVLERADAALPDPDGGGELTRRALHECARRALADALGGDDA
jgi:CO/xanthine dehydrogenase FAD-binding subunit